MKRFVEHIIKPNIPTGILMLVGCLCLWIPEALILDSAGSVSLLPRWSIALPAWLNFVLCLLAVVGNGLWLSALLFKAFITRTRTMFVVFLYVFAMGCLPFLRGDLGLQVVVFLLVWILSILVDMYKMPYMAASAYNIGLIVAAMVCLYTEGIWLVPIVYGLLLIQNAVSLRSSLAYLLGLSTIYWMISGVSLLMGYGLWLPWERLDLIWNPDDGLATIMGILSLVGLGFVVVIYTRWFSFGIRVRVFVNVLVMLWVLFLALSLCTSSGMFFCSLCSVPIIALAVNFLYATYALRVYRILFSIFLFALLGIYVYCTWFYGMA